MFLSQFPITTCGRLGRDVNRLFDDVFSGFETTTRRRNAMPAMNVWEEDDCVFVEAEVPGFAEKDIEVQVAGNELTIRGERKCCQENEAATYHRRERCLGEFARTLTLPFEVNTEKVEATLKEGLLTVKVPKAESAKSRLVPVSSN